MYLDSSISVSSPPSLKKEEAFLLKDFLLEQGSGPVNEDALSTDNGVFIVCDGATGISANSGGTSGGKQAADIVARTFSENSGSFYEMAIRANDEIRRAMESARVCLDKREELWSTSFAAVRFWEERLEWAQAGDCTIQLIYRDGSSRFLTGQTGHDVQTLQKWRLIGPNASGTIYEELTAEIVAVRKQMNRTYGVINGEPEAGDFLNQGTISTAGVSDILLYSDGMELPNRFPEKEQDPQILAGLYLEFGLEGVRDHIRALQQKDPCCYIYPRFKKHDDISAIALQKRD